LITPKNYFYAKKLFLRQKTFFRPKNFLTPKIFVTPKNIFYANLQKKNNFSEQLKFIF